MHKLVAFILGCVAGYALNECIEAVISNMPAVVQEKFPIPSVREDLVQPDSA